MKFRSLLLVACGLAISASMMAQEVWSLEKCINYAQTNSISSRQNEAVVQGAELDLKLSKTQRLPSVNGRASFNRSFGRTIDPTTNQFVSQSFSNNTYSINANATIFNGNRINNTIKQSKLDLQAAQLDAESNLYTVSLNIATAYLNILLSEEQLTNAQKRLEITREQLKQTDQLIQAGSLPPVDRLDILAQIAQQEQQIIDAANLVATNYLTLRQQMEVGPDVNFQIEKPEITIPENANPELFKESELYNTAVGVMPDIKAGEMRYKSSLLDIDIAKAAFYPTLGVGASISTNYSTNFNTIIGFEPVQDIENVLINNEPGTITFSGSRPLTERTPYFDQLNENLGQGFGFSLDIPIFNRNQNVVAVQRAKLGVINAELNNRQLKQTLRTNVQRAVLDARTAQRSLVAAQTSLQAAQVAFENAQKRFDLGAINALEYTTARNTLDQAQVELTRSKYQYFFNLKVVDFYTGKPLKLD